MWETAQNRSRPQVGQKPKRRVDTLAFRRATGGDLASGASSPQARGLSSRASPLPGCSQRAVRLQVRPAVRQATNSELVSGAPNPQARGLSISKYPSTKLPLESSQASGALVGNFIRSSLDSGARLGYHSGIEPLF